MPDRQTDSLEFVGKGGAQIVFCNVKIFFRLNSFLIKNGVLPRTERQKLAHQAQQRDTNKEQRHLECYAGGYACSNVSQAMFQYNKEGVLLYQHGHIQKEDALS